MHSAAVNLPPYSPSLNPFVNKEAVVAGWGVTSTEPDGSMNLLCGWLPACPHACLPSCLPAWIAGCLASWLGGWLTKLASQLPGQGACDGGCLAGCACAGFCGLPMPRQLPACGCRETIVQVLDRRECLDWTDQEISG